MGGHELAMEIFTKSEDKFKKLFEAKKEADRKYYGSDPYSGSWNTIDRVKIVSDPFPERKWTKKKKREVMNWISDQTDKGEAKAVKTSNSYLVLGWACS